MKKITLLVLVFALALSNCTQAQTQAKRYILLEHFTNTPCSICGSQNPGFFNTIANFPDDVHHISYHTQFPYSTCIFYQANTVQNSARTAFYNISSTPRVLRNGLNASSASQVTSAVLQGLQGQTSPIVVAVSETGTTNRSATIQVHTLGEAPGGNLRLFVALAEREIQYNAPNGETLHHNVFRRMLTNISGDSFTPAATGGTKTFSFDYSIESGWNADQIYAIAFVQNIDTKEVLNSGTRFDPVVTALSEVEQTADFKIYPNPVSDILNIQFREPTSGTASLLNLTGAVLWDRPLENTSFTSFDLGSNPPGIYIIRVQTDQGTQARQVVRF